MKVFHFEQKYWVWDGVRVTGYLVHDNDDAAIVTIEGKRYIAAVDENGDWRLHDDYGDNLASLRGPYTYEQVIAIMRLLS
jgi:hypothetical protein